MANEHLYTKESFLKAVREKYPVYNEWDDDSLFNRLLEKYPVYKDQIAPITPQISPQISPAETLARLQPAPAVTTAVKPILPTEPTDVYTKPEEIPPLEPVFREWTPPVREPTPKETRKIEIEREREWLKEHPPEFPKWMDAFAGGFARALPLGTLAVRKTEMDTEAEELYPAVTGAGSFLGWAYTLGGLSKIPLPGVMKIAKVPFLLKHPKVLETLVSMHKTGGLFAEYRGIKEVEREIAERKFTPEQLATELGKGYATGATVSLVMKGTGELAKVAAFTKKAGYERPFARIYLTKADIEGIAMGLPKASKEGTEFAQALGPEKWVKLIKQSRQNPSSIFEVILPPKTEATIVARPWFSKIAKIFGYTPKEISLIKSPAGKKILYR